MKMTRRPRRKQPDAFKLAVYAIIVNVLEIISALGLTVYLFMGKSPNALSKTAVVFLSVVVTLGAIVDIREAVDTIRVRHDLNSLDETVQAMTDQNHALRAQRHDFLNHLQVIYGLMEMKEYDDAMHYMEEVYGDIRSLGKTLRTANAPVNALLMAKSEECREKGIDFETEIHARWERLPIRDWEMCRCLSNLIDNARDALKDTRHPKIRVYLDENMKECSFTVRNNGPRIPEEIAESIFEAGFSGKGEGRGMGLFITKQTLEEAGGSISVESNDRWTAFRGVLPLAPMQHQDGETEQGTPA
ncbi:MAG: Spo0B domain-containing protein [Clostridia bacterium]|nr:Spo0B domain-containing protein [Clostridia bacterium]